MHGSLCAYTARAHLARPRLWFPRHTHGWRTRQGRWCACTHAEGRAPSLPPTPALTCTHMHKQRWHHTNIHRLTFSANPANNTAHCGLVGQASPPRFGVIHRQINAQNSTYFSSAELDPTRLSRVQTNGSHPYAKLAPLYQHGIVHVLLCQDEWLGRLCARRSFGGATGAVKKRYGVLGVGTGRCQAGQVCVRPMPFVAGVLCAGRSEPGEHRHAVRL